MMKRTSLVVLALFATALAGCYPTQYTHVEKIEDGYILTKNKAGFFRVHGEVWKCVTSGPEAFNCREVSEK